MKRKLYLPPESRLTLVRTEQGICYSSNEEAKIEEGDINVDPYKEVDNELTFD